MGQKILKVIHENHEVRLHLEFKPKGRGRIRQESYECRLGKVNDHWELRVQRRPPDGSTLRFGQHLSPDMLPRGSYFDLSRSTKALNGLSDWAASQGFEIERDPDNRRALLVPAVVALTLRLPRKLHEELRRRVYKRSAESINSEIIEILKGEKPRL